MADGAPNTLESKLDDMRIEHGRIDDELHEINAKLEQSQGELGRLQARNAKATAELKQLQDNFEAESRSAIKEGYEAVQDTQQRLFIMRGQVEKLQVEKSALERYVGTMEQLMEVMADAVPKEPAGAPEVASKSTAIRVVEAQEAERKRLAKQMHDGPAQSLTNFILQAEICQRFFDRDVDRALEELINLKSSASTTFQRVREFIVALRPMSLEDLGLGPTVRSYVDSFGEKSGIGVYMEVLGDEKRPLETYRQVIVFRAIQELLANVREHANATEVQVTLDMSGDMITATVDDNGEGFAADELGSVLADYNSVGLPVLQERVESVGGELSIESVPGKGANITLSIPAESAE